MIVPTLITRQLYRSFIRAAVSNRYAYATFGKSEVLPRHNIVSFCTFLVGHYVNFKLFCVVPPRRCFCLLSAGGEYDLARLNHFHLDHRKSKMSRPLVSVYDPETADAVVGTVTLPVRIIMLCIETCTFNDNNRHHLHFSCSTRQFSLHPSEVMSSITFTP